jgi:nucleolar MIF4G domain-containing protein 1
MGKLKLNAKKGKDRKKDGGKTKGAITRIQTRKEKRKNEREQKKKRKETFFKKKYGKMTPAPLEEKVKKEQNGVGNKRKEEEDKATKEEKKRKKREREEKKVRKLNLRRDNEAEEKTIRQLEKQLGIKKKKSKEGKLPKSFIEDGLDFLMEVCDPDKMKLLQEGGDADEFDEEEDGFLKELQGDDDEDSEDQPEDDDSDAVDGEMGEEGDVADSEGEEKEDMEDGRDMDNDDSEEEEEEEEDESDDELEEEEISDSESNTGKVWEDIYGRTRDAKGKVVNGTSSKSTSAPTEGGSKYVPPALRAKMLGGHDEKRREEMLRLQRKVKGLLNRLAASNMSGIAKELEGLYASHSRNDMNECLSKLFFDSLISPALAPERLVMEHALLIGVLHCNVGVEVGATMLQVMVKKFHQSYLDYAAPDDTQQNSDKTLENYALVISHLYTFKVTNCDLIYDMLDMLVDT